ncbi:hypothetical protein [Agromyces atrinae]|nr:hypothetical protein [Agromyces atrinae]
MPGWFIIACVLLIICTVLFTAIVLLLVAEALEHPEEGIES